MDIKSYDKVIETEVEGKKIKLTFPTIGQSSEGDLEYSKAYTKALKAGLMPRIVMDRQIKESSLWTDKEDKEIDDLRDTMQETLFKAKTEKDPVKKSELKYLFDEMKFNYAVLTTKKQSLYTHTAESKGEEAKIAHLAWKCVLNEDGSRVWNSQEEFYNEKNTQFISYVITEFIKFTSGLDEKVNDLDVYLDEEEDEETEEEVKKEKGTEEVKKEEVQVIAEEVKA